MGQTRNIAGYNSPAWQNAISKLTNTKDASPAFELRIDNGVLWKGYKAGDAGAVANTITSALAFALARRDEAQNIAHAEAFLEPAAVELEQTLLTIGHSLDNDHQLAKAAQRQLDKLGAKLEKRFVFQSSKDKIVAKANDLANDLAKLNKSIARTEKKYASLHSQYIAATAKPVDITPEILDIADKRVHKSTFDIGAYKSLVQTHLPPVTAQEQAQDWIASLDANTIG